MTKRQRAKTSDLLVAARRALALSLKVQGGSNIEIAAQLQEVAAAEREKLEEQRKHAAGLPYDEAIWKPGEPISALANLSEKYDEKRVHDDLMAELNKRHQESAKSVDAIRQLELERLDELQATIWGKATARHPDYFAFDRVLAVMDRRATYLGLAAARKIQLEVDKELENALDLLKHNLPPDVYAQVIETLASGGASEPAPAD